MENRLVSTGFAARKFGVTRVTIQRWVAAGHLHATRLPSGTWRINASDIDRLLGKEVNGTSYVMEEVK